MPDPREQIVDFRFPLRGLDVSQAYASQPQMSTPTGVNVRAYDPFTQRARGGQRPGMNKYVKGQLLGGASLVQELNVVVGVGYANPGPPDSDVVQQSVGTTVTGGTSATDTFQVGLTNGNAVLVLIGYTNVSGTVTVTDGTNTYTRINQASLSSYTVSAWLATSVTGSPTSVTVNWTSASAVDVVSFEIANVTGHEQNSNVSGVGTSGIDTGWTAAHSPNLNYYTARTGSSIGQTAGSGYSKISSAVNPRFWVALKRSTTTGTLGSDLAWGWPVFDDWAGVQGGIEVSS